VLIAINKGVNKAVANKHLSKAKLWPMLLLSCLLRPFLIAFPNSQKLGAIGKLLKVVKKQS